MDFAFVCLTFDTAKQKEREREREGGTETDRDGQLKRSSRLHFKHTQKFLTRKHISHTLTEGIVSLTCNLLHLDINVHIFPSLPTVSESYHQLQLILCIRNLIVDMQ